MNCHLFSHTVHLLIDIAVICFFRLSFNASQRAPADASCGLEATSMTWQAFGWIITETNPVPCKSLIHPG